MLVLVLSGLAAARRVAQTRQTRLCKAARHLLTVAGRTPTRSATALLLSPSAMARITSARNAMRRSVFAAPSQPLKVARCSSVNITSAALITAGYHVRQFTQLATSQAAKSRPSEKISPVPIAATVALAMIGPIPGTLISGSQPVSWRTITSISRDNPSMR
jgi:hypothetical protein